MKKLQYKDEVNNLKQIKVPIDLLKIKTGVRHNEGNEMRRRVFADV